MSYASGLYNSLYAENQKYSKDKLGDIFDTLPEEIKEAIFSVDSAEAITSIGQKYSLHIDQTALLGQETGYVLLGITDPMEFAPILASKLGVDKQTAGNIVMDINDKIFVKVKEALRQVHSGQKLSSPVTTEQKAPNLIKTVETEKLNIPKPTLDVLQGKVLEEKKKDTSILGFQEAPLKPIGQMDILSEKMKTGFSVPGEETEVEEKKTMGKVVDPYRELP